MGQDGKDPFSDFFDEDDDEDFIPASPDDAGNTNGGREGGKGTGRGSGVDTKRRDETPSSCASVSFAPVHVGAGRTPRTEGGFMADRSAGEEADAEATAAYRVGRDAPVVIGGNTFRTSLGLECGQEEGLDVDEGGDYDRHLHAYRTVSYGEGEAAGAHQSDDDDGGGRRYRSIQVYLHLLCIPSLTPVFFVCYQCDERNDDVDEERCRPIHKGARIARIQVSITMWISPYTHTSAGAN